MTKNIHQLRKLANRCRRRSAGAMHALLREKSPNPSAKPWKGLTGRGVNFYRMQVNVCAMTLTAIKKDLLSRRVGLAAVRPPKVKYPSLPPIVLPGSHPGNTCSRRGAANYPSVTV